MTNKFKVGDRVKINPLCDVPDITNNKTYKIIMTDMDKNIWITDDIGIERCFLPIRFDLVERKIDDKWYKAEELENMKELHKNKCGHTNYNRMPIQNELDNKNYKYNGEKWMEEFKVDKLGWYESGEGKKYKVIHILSNPTEFYPILAIDENDSFNMTFTEKGIFSLNSNTHSGNLIKYLGPELPKEPRVFEFEAENIEKPNDKESTTSRSVISKAIGHCVTPLNHVGNHRQDELAEGLKVTKWHIIMKEIIEDENK